MKTLIISAFILANTFAVDYIKQVDQKFSTKTLNKMAVIKYGLSDIEEGKVDYDSAKAAAKMSIMRFKLASILGRKFNVVDKSMVSTLKGTTAAPRIDRYEKVTAYMTRATASLTPPADLNGKKCNVITTTFQIEEPIDYIDPKAFFKVHKYIYHLKHDIVLDHLQEKLKFKKFIDFRYLNTYYEIKGDKIIYTSEYIIRQVK